VWLRGNILKRIDDLPDKPRFGVNLMAAGLAVGALRLGWPHVAPGSYQRASALFARIEPYLPHRSQYPPALDDLGGYLTMAVLVLLFCGVFIFFRRGVWWWQERADEKSITRLDLK
jgi:hypothetical protein